MANALRLGDYVRTKGPVPVRTKRERGDPRVVLRGRVVGLEGAGVRVKITDWGRLGAADAPPSLFGYADLETE